MVIDLCDAAIARGESIIIIDGEPYEAQKLKDELTNLNISRGNRDP